LQKIVWMGEGMFMSLQNERDPRSVLVREKYFSLRPKPLERWLWDQGVPQAAERVFWLHWEEGMRRGDWCSEVPLRIVARECRIDLSTVTRAYQVLRKLSLIRREDPGRDASNPFQQATAVTEVRIPKELLVDLGRAPNRQRRGVADATTVPAAKQALRQPATESGVSARGEAGTNVERDRRALKRLTREESSVLMQRLSATERSEFYCASRDRRTSMNFDAGGALTSDERGRVLDLLAQISMETPKPLIQQKKQTPPRAAPEYARVRKLTVLETARVRKTIVQLVPLALGSEVFRQVLWSIEEGALRRFDPRLAANIALKKIREGAWSRPNRMPPNWLPRAVPETCSAA
jgi:hypothetical protein